MTGTAFAEVGDSYWKQGNELYHAGKWDKAIAQYKLALKINPDHLRAWQNLGLAYQSKKDLAQAVKTFQHIKGMDPSFFPAYISLGLVYSQKGRYAEAEKEYAQAVRLEPDNLIGYLNLSAVQAKQKRYGPAYRSARRGMRLHPGNPHLHLLEANIYFVKGKFASARRAYAKALALEPRTPAVRLAMAECLAQEGDNAAALRQVANVQSEDARFPGLAKARGRIHALRFYREKKGWDEAVQQYRLAQEHDTEDKEIWRALGDLYAAKAQYDQARKWYQRLVNHAKTSVQERQALEKTMKSWPKPKTKASHANVSSKL